MTKWIVVWIAHLAQRYVLTCRIIIINPAGGGDVMKTTFDGRDPNSFSIKWLEENEVKKIGNFRTFFITYYLGQYDTFIHKKRTKKPTLSTTLHPYTTSSTY